MPRNLHTSARRLLRILAWLENGDEVTYELIESTFGIQRAQARDDMAVLVDVRDVEVFQLGRKKAFRRGCCKNWSAVVARVARLEFGSAALDLLSGTVFDDEATTLAAELASTVPADKRTQLERLVGAFHHRRVERSSLGQGADVVSDLLDAIQLGFCVRARYVRLRDGEAQEYVLGPCALVLWHDRLQLVAEKVATSQLRTFDIDGFVEVSVVRGERFAPPANFSIQERFEHSIGRYADFPVIDVELQVTGQWAYHLQRTPAHASQVVHASGDGLDVRLRVCDCPDLESWILSMTPDVRVVAPLGLAARIDAALRLAIGEPRPNAATIDR